MSERKKPDQNVTGPTSMLQLSMPFLETMLETDVPSFVFQPMKVMALGQIQAASLVNKRCLACLEFPQKLAACRSPEDFAQEQQRFFQAALDDYSDAVAAMTKAWGKAVVEQSEPAKSAQTDHDYLPLPGPEVNEQDIEEQEESRAIAPQNGSRPEGVTATARARSGTRQP